ncbi:Ff.00g070460.m01.CDS01 [Fusarium sp. VM40]|nr:Ff.00g070460.m01.CDS01 [Fusarium sp. VM40]
MAAASHHFQASVTLPFSPTAASKKRKPPILKGPSDPPPSLGPRHLLSFTSGSLPSYACNRRAPAFVTCQDSQTRPLRLSFSRTVTGVSGVTGALTQHPGGVSGGVVFVKKTPEPGRVAMGFDALVQATSKPIRLRCLSER